MKRFLIILLFLSSAHGEEVSVTLTTDKTQLSLEGQIELQVSVQGSRRGEHPELLNAENFDVQSSGTQSQVQIINGQVSQRLMFGFVLTPKQPGKFRVGPARVSVDGKFYESTPIEITVAKGSQNANTENRNFFYLVAEVDNKTPYVNQQVNYTFHFFNRARLGNAQLGLPEFKGFLKEGPDKQRDSEQVVNGVQWQVTSMRFALFPVSSGTLTIEPSRLVADAAVQGQRQDSFFDDFFAMNRTKRVNLKSQELQITVNALPTGSRPPSFSGLVGHFELKAQIGRQTLAVGDSTTLTIKIEGDGNLRDFALPEFTSTDFKIYDDQPSFDLKAGKPWKGTKTFKRALIPLKPGELLVPPVTVSYFDPNSKSYKTIESQRLVIKASGSLDNSVTHVAPTAQLNSKKTIEIVGKDLMPIKRAPSSLRNSMLTPRERWFILLVSIASLFGYGLLFIFKRRNDKLTSNVGLVRKSKAYREFTSGLKKINQNSTFFQEASLLLREYLGNKFNLDGKALAPSDLARKLSPSISQESIKQIEMFLRDCEGAQYGGIRSSESRESLLTMVNTIEKEVRR